MKGKKSSKEEKSDEPYESKDMFYVSPNEEGGSQLHKTQEIIERRTNRVIGISENSKPVEIKLGKITETKGLDKYLKRPQRLTLEEQIKTSLSKSFWIDGDKCPASDKNPFWNDQGVYAFLNDLRPKNDSKFLQKKLGVSKEQVRHIRDVFASRASEFASDFRFNVYGTQYAVDDREFVVTYKGEVLEVGSDAYKSFMKEFESYAGRIMKHKFGNVNVRQKLFIIPKNISEAAAYVALESKLSEVLKVNEYEKSK